MGISRRERLAAANLRKEEPNVTGESIIDDLITRTERNAENADAGRNAEDTGPDGQEHGSLPERMDAVQSVPKKRPGRPRKNPGAGREQGGEAAESSHIDGADIFARLQRRAKAEKKSTRMSVAVYPSTELYLKKAAEEIGCSVNDLINEILIDWKESRES